MNRICMDFIDFWNIMSLNASVVDYVRMCNLNDNNLHVRYWLDLFMWLILLP